MRAPDIIVLQWNRVPKPAVGRAIIAQMLHRIAQCQYFMFGGPGIIPSPGQPDRGSQKGTV